MVVLVLILSFVGQTYACITTAENSEYMQCGPDLKGYLIGGKCMMYVNKTQSLMDSRVNCKLEGGRLFEPENNCMFANLTQLFLGAYPTFVDASDGAWIGVVLKSGLFFQTTVSKTRVSFDVQGDCPLRSRVFMQLDAGAGILRFYCSPREEERHSVCEFPPVC